MKESRDVILVKWWSDKRNFGDALNPILVKHISGKQPIMADCSINIKNKPVYAVIGSILDNNSDENLIIWGSGFMHSTGKFIKKPKKICAVRGPLSRDIIIKQGIYCPEIYGDPALLYPLIYRPSIKKEYKLGIIPHYADQKNHLLNKFNQNSNVITINILGEVNAVVDDICKCEYIASSSLHGIIAADAYGIPSIWIKFSDDVSGGEFKFLDYFMSVGRKDREPLEISEDITLQDIYDRFYAYKINIDLARLLEVCPFKQ